MEWLCTSEHLVNPIGTASRNGWLRISDSLALESRNNHLILFKVLALIPEAGTGLPLGLSFYIFKMISYQADLYRGQIRRRPKFINTAAYFTMFPQITQGPIMRYGDGFGGRKNAHIVTAEQFEDGLVYLVLGLGMKVLLADRIGILWNEITKIGYESISTPLAWMGAYGYSFELFYDFWGYSLMAAGIGMMLGFPFIDNFIHPYAAGSISEFYRRWHATLGHGSGIISTSRSEEAAAVKRRTSEIL